MSGRAAASVWLVLALGAVTMIGPFSIDAYLPGLPGLAKEFGVTESAAQLSLAACLLGLALGQLVAGPWSDRVGRRLPLLLGCASYAVVSAACAFAPSIETLVVLRFLQGLTGAIGLVTSRAVVRDVAVGGRAVSMYSHLATVTGIGPIAAPLLGALVIDTWGWRGVFLGLAGLGVVVTVFAAIATRETLDPSARFAGSARETILAFRALLDDRVFLVFVVAGALGSATLFGYIAGSPFVLQETYGLDAGGFAIVFAVNGIGLAVCSQLNSRLAPRLGAERILRVALAVQAAAAIAVLVLVVAGGRDEVALMVMIGLLVVLVAPLGFVYPNTTALSMARSGRHAGTASALLGVGSFLIGAIVSPLAGIGGDPSLAMAVVVALTAVGAAVLVFTGVPRQTTAARSTQMEEAR